MNIKTSDGIELYACDWLPATGPRRGTALIVHGLGEHCRRYAHVAAALNAIGVAVRGYDHRGFGQSGGPRATLPAPNTLLDDLALVFDRLAAEAHAAGDLEPPFLIGHSMGGAIAARAVTGGWVRPRGLVLSSPALKLHLPAAVHGIIRAVSAIAPHFARPHGLPVGKISHDSQVLAEAAADPLCHDVVTPRLIAFLIDAGKQTLRDAAKLAVPTLLLVSGDDRFVDPAGARLFAEAAPGRLCTFKLYPALYHELFNELALDRARVLGDLTDWIDGQIGGRCG